MSDVVTGEAVPLELRLAKLPSRALAIGIDLVVYAACALGIYTLVANIVPAVDTALATALGLAATIALLVAVPATIETLTRGRSLGKLALGLRVVRDDGGPIRARHSLVRALSGVFADFVITSGVGAIFCSLLNERGKRIGDVLAGTVVIRERIPVSPGLPPVHPQLAGWATTLELSQLPNDLALAARNYLSRSGQLSPQVRDDLGARLAAQVASVVSPPPPHGVPPWQYLAAVLHERGRRESVRLAGHRGGTQPPNAQPSSPQPSTPDAQPDPGAQTSPGPERQTAPSSGAWAPPASSGAWATPESSTHSAAQTRPEPSDGGSPEPSHHDEQPRTGGGFVPPA
ncbi:RDD family protein [Phytoactinopolyspora alkaliphila]|uniref:RDD family protein n=1 Tax=Phytoactinopolyspora alkaliphila TaxID=1783498 RepID=A0A6N9YQN4_9ACTN|nr:RDD family protein [Phytoactinopolyspora alkaliphila]NED97292.1 RDD family protein [Phytoactinopolyspora alkaliphila]